MDKVKAKLRGVKTSFNNDWNIIRAKRLVKRGVRAAPHGAARYMLNKVPFAKWIPAYNFRWLPNDALSGITVGIVLVLQAVNLAVPTPGGISAQQILLASWLPGFIYAITGTSKNISVGPTTSSLVLTLQLVGGISAAAKIPVAVVLPALTLAVSAWFLLFGLLGLGFIFDVIPVFLCIAIVTALSIIVTTLQLPILLGLIGIPAAFTSVIPATIASITNVSGSTIAVSVSALVFLAVLSKLKTKWGKEKTMRGRLARGGVASGALFVLVLFTAVSFFLLKDLPLSQQVAPYIPPVAPGAAPASAPPASAPSAPPVQPQTTGGGAVPVVDPAIGGPPTGVVRRQESGPQTPPVAAAPVGTPGAAAGALSSSASAPPTGAGAPMSLPKLPFWPAFPKFFTSIPMASMPVFKLAQSLFIPSALLFLAINIEHIVVARFFAHEHEYTISKSQEMFSLGLINLANAFFGGVPVGGGDMARSSVLGYTGVRSPMNQVFTSITVLVAMEPASAALRFVPQAILAVVIMISVVDQMPPQSLMNTYFKLSFADFVAFFFVMNVAIVGPPGLNAVIGAGFGFVFLMVYHLLRVMFKGPKIIRSEDLESLLNATRDNAVLDRDVIPQSTLVLKPDGDIIFSNSERLRRYILDAAYLNNSGKAGESGDESERTWDNPVESYVNSIRRQNGANEAEALVIFRPRLRMIILDMTSTTFIDSSALMSLELLKKQMRAWAGETLEFRFVGLNKHLRKRFERAKWQIVDPFGPQVVYEDQENDIRDFAFDNLPLAVRYMSQEAAMNGTFSQIMGMSYDMEKKSYNIQNTKSYDV